MIRVLLADDEALIRSGLAVLLRHEPGFEVVGSAADGLSAVRLAHEQRPDVVLMDVRMPGIDGIEATRRLVADPATASVRKSPPPPCGSCRRPTRRSASTFATRCTRSDSAR